MSNNNPFFPPTGNNNNNNNKRKARTYLPAGDDTNRQKKRRAPPQTANTPMMAPPAQPGYGYGTPQMANPAVYGPQNTTPFPGMGSTSLAPQYPQFQAPFQPQAQYMQQPPQHVPQLGGYRPGLNMQQPPQHVPQPGGYRPGLNMQLTPGFPNMGFAAGQQQLTSQAPADAPVANSSQKSKRKPKIELIQAENVDTHGTGFGGMPTALSVKGRPGKDNFVAETNDPNATISTASGERGRAVVNAQYSHHESMHGGDSRVLTAMLSQPLMSTGLPEHSRGSGISDSTENLISTKTGGRRKKPGKPQAQAQAQAPALAPAPAPAPVPAPAPAPAQHLAQGHPQGQNFSPCPNCKRADHLVGDCVGPPNAIHGDLPACPICDSFGGRLRGATGPTGHRLDDCQRVQAVFHRLEQDMDSRLAYEDLIYLTDDELYMFFHSLVSRRVRKVPIRTRLVCWMDVLRETARRFPESPLITSLGKKLPWTKDFALEQRWQTPGQAKPWGFYDYAAGDLQSLPMCPLEQVALSDRDFVANGMPDLPPQVFDSGHRQRQTNTMDVDDPSTADSAQPQVDPEQPQQPQQPPQQPAPAQAAPNPQAQQPPQMGAGASGVAATIPRSYGDDVPAARVPPPFHGARFHGEYGQKGLGGSAFNQGPSSMPPMVPPDAGIFSAALPPPSSATGASATPVAQSGQASSDHASFMNVAGQTQTAGAQSSQASSDHAAFMNVAGQTQTAGAQSSQASSDHAAFMNVAGQTQTAGAQSSQASSDHAAFMDVAGHGPQSAQPSTAAPAADPNTNTASAGGSSTAPLQPSATAAGASQNNLSAAPAAPLPPSTTSASVAPGQLELASSTALPAADKDEDLIDYTDEEL